MKFDIEIHDASQDESQEGGASIMSFEMPCAEAVLAAALALTSAMAQGACSDCRADMTTRVIGHLEALACHPMLSDGFRAMLWHLRTSWQISQDNERAVAQALVRSHPAPSTIH